jgi:hypothetical protein
LVDFDEIYDGFPPDEREIEAIDRLREFFDENREKVFFSRQLEVFYEHEYFHWITNRAIRALEAEGLIKSERRKLRTGTFIKLLWHKGYSFRREAPRSLSLWLKSTQILERRLDFTAKPWC